MGVGPETWLVVVVVSESQVSVVNTISPSVTVVEKVGVLLAGAGSTFMVVVRVVVLFFVIV